MLTVRREQLETLGHAQSETFEAELLEHVRAAFGATCDAIGAAGARALVARAIEECLSRGWRRRQVITDVLDRLFRQREQVVADRAAALHAALLEQDAFQLGSRLEDLAP